jgi:hypothetical protein
MPRVEIQSIKGIVIDSAHDTYEEAQARAMEVFTCVIAAVSRDLSGEQYLRPAGSRDRNIFAYAVLTIGE